MGANPIQETIMNCPFCDQALNINEPVSSFQDDMRCSSCPFTPFCIGKDDKIIGSWIYLIFNKIKLQAVWDFRNDNFFIREDFPPWEIIFEIGGCNQNITPNNIMDKLPILLTFS